MMADLNSIKNKNAERLKRAQRVPLPDPRVGYKPVTKSATVTTEIETPTAPEAEAPITSEPEAPKAIETKADTAEPEAVKKPKEHRPQADAAPDQAGPAKEAPKRDQPPKQKPAAEVKQEGNTAVRVGFQFSETDYPRVQAIAQKLGVKPEAILLKVLQAATVGPSDFTENSKTKRVGPTNRRLTTMPKAEAEAWLKANDPLGVAINSGVVLRPVALNAFDRTVPQVLNQLEGKKA